MGPCCIGEELLTALNGKGFDIKRVHGISSNWVAAIALR